MICAAVSRLLRGLRGGSVSKTGCYFSVRINPSDDMHFVHGVNCVLFGTYIFAQCFQPFCINVLPYPLHVIPVCDNPMLQGVVYFEEPPNFALCASSDEYVSF